MDSAAIRGTKLQNCPGSPSINYIETVNSNHTGMKSVPKKDSGKSLKRVVLVNIA